MKATNHGLVLDVLDVGCGAYPVGQVNVDRFRVNNPRHCAKSYNGKDFLNFIQADAHFLPFRNKTFRRIVCDNALEHCGNPKNVLCEFKRIATRNITLFVPNSEHTDRGTKTHVCHWFESTLINMIRHVFGDVEFRVEKLAHSRSGRPQIRAIIELGEVKR